MDQVFVKKKTYLLSQIKIMALIILLGCILSLMEHNKMILIIAASISVIFLIVEILRYRYSKYLKVGEVQIEEGKSIIPWSDVTFLEFTLDKTGPYILIYANEKKHSILAQEYDRSLELRELLESICIQNEIRFKVDDRGSIGYYDKSRNHINTTDLIFGFLIAWAPILFLVLIVALVVMFGKP